MSEIFSIEKALSRNPKEIDPDSTPGFMLSKGYLPLSRFAERRNSDGQVIGGIIYVHAEGLDEQGNLIASSPEAVDQNGKILKDGIIVTIDQALDIENPHIRKIGEICVSRGDVEMKFTHF